MALIFAAAVLALVLSAAAPAPAAVVEIAPTALGQPEPVAVNDNGVVAGRFRGGADSRGFRWSNGDYTLLEPLPDGEKSWVYDINNAGQVVGWSKDTERAGPDAVIWPAGFTFPNGLGHLYPDDPYRSSQARAVNEAGVAAGYAGAYQDYNPVIFNNGTVTNFQGDADGHFDSFFDSTALAINESNVVLAYPRRGTIEGTDASGAKGALFLWHAATGSYTDLTCLGKQPLGTLASAPNALNDSNAVVSTDGAARRWQDGTCTDLIPLPGDTGAGVVAINDGGSMVGASGGAGREPHAVVWQADGRVTDLNAELPPDSGWVLLQAIDINNRGQVLGVGRHNGVGSYFLLTPTRIPQCSDGRDNDGDGRIDFGADRGCESPADESEQPDPPESLATNGNDTVNGDDGPNVICGLYGDDTINGNGGNDKLFGDACGKLAKAQTARALKDGNDKLFGGGGKDTLFGAGGNDTLRGDKGDDRLFGGRGVDKFKGGAGNDSLNARDGKKETVDCGSGKNDQAKVDKGDKVNGCEKVKRT